jgi:ElaB/YqjD/DUF883 family membrane-anchored ribosome-binding protein
MVKTMLDPRESIMSQPGSSDYRSSDMRETTEGIMDQMAETARDMGDRAVGLAGDIGSAVRERPYTTLAIAAGLAFAVGALWKLGHQRPPSRWDALMARAPELPSKDWLPKRWR